MKSVLIGIGQCGGKLTTEITQYTRSNDVQTILGAVAINTATTDLQNLPIQTQLIGESHVKGNGVGGDNELGLQIMQDDMHEVTETIKNITPSETEAIILLAGLGGGTGSGGCPALVRELNTIYTIPIYVLGVLPSATESTLAKYNAGRSLQTLRETPATTILIDNDTWKQTGQSLTNWYSEINTSIAERMSLLLTAGEFTGVSAEMTVDSSEIINTLRETTFAAIGHGTTPSATDSTQNINNITTATRKSITTGLSITGDVTARKGLVIVAGEQNRISRKGIEKSREILETAFGTQEVRGGDYPLRNETQIHSISLASGINPTNRITDLIQTTKQSIDEETNNEEDKYFQHDAVDGLDINLE